MQIFVTGAAGFIGSHLCERLIAAGHVVVGYDNFDAFYPRAVKEANLAALRSESRFTLVAGDIRDADAVAAALGAQPVEAVVHLAARAGVRPSLADPLGYEETNVKGTMVLLEAARQRGVGKFIFASSSSVYGNNRQTPFSESDSVDGPISPYAATKKAGELLCHAWHHLYGLDVTCLRFFTAYGPRQRPDLAIHKFTRLIEAGAPIPVYGDGSMSRDFTYIDDIIDGVVAAIDRCRGYEIFNLGESQPIRLDELIGELEQALGKKAVIDRRPVPPGDVRRTYADITKARAQLGYQPRTALAEGLRAFVEWFRRHQALV